MEFKFKLNDEVFIVWDQKRNPDYTLGRVTTINRSHMVINAAFGFDKYGRHGAEQMVFPSTLTELENLIYGIPRMEDRR